MKSSTHSNSYTNPSKNVLSLIAAKIKTFNNLLNRIADGNNGKSMVPFKPWSLQIQEPYDWSVEPGAPKHYQMSSELLISNLEATNRITMSPETAVIPHSKVNPYLFKDII